jgi:hypothetical protein
MKSKYNVAHVGMDTPSVVQFWAVAAAMISAGFARHSGTNFHIMSSA